MTKLFYIILVLHLSPISPLLSMNPPKKLYAVKVLPTYNKIALATEQGCFIITNPLSSSNRIVEQYWNKPIYDLATNKNKTQICLRTQSSAVVYDVHATQPSISFKSHYSPVTEDRKNFKAVFCHDDSLITVRDTDIFKDGKKICELPHLGMADFNIACHPTQKAILYPTSASALLFRDIGQTYTTPTKRYKLHPPLDDNFVKNVFYDHTGNHIGLLTEGGRVGFYNPNCKSSTFFEVELDPFIDDAAFLFRSSAIALVSDINGIFFWNPIDKTTSHIPIAPSDEEFDDLIYRKKIDFFPNESEFVVTLINHCFLGNIPPQFMTRKMILIILILKEYGRTHGDFLHPDIIALLVKKIAAAQTSKLIPIPL
jgi:hypothetical protein